MNAIDASVVDTAADGLNIVAFCCHYCAYAAADMAGSLRMQYPESVKVVKLPCTGKLDVQLILDAFEHGADGVMIAGCNLQTAWFADPDWQLEYQIVRTIETAEMAYALLLVQYSDTTLRDEPYDKQHYLSLVFTRKGGSANAEGTWSLVHDQTTIVL